MFPRAGRGPLAFGLIVAATVSVATTFAQSDRVPVTLEWRAPSCSSSREVLAEVAQLLGGEAVGSKPVDARATVAPLSRGRLRVTVVTRIDGREGERALDVASCAEAVQASALVVALAVDPARVAAHRAQVASTEAGTVTPLALDAGGGAPANAAPTPLSNASSTDAAPPPPNATATSADAAAESIADAADDAPAETPAPIAAVAPAASTAGEEWAPWIVGAAAIGDVGSLPQLAGGGALVIGVQTPALRGEIGFHALVPQATDDRARGGSFGLVGGEMRGCYFVLRSSVELAPCVALAGDRIAASGRNVAAPSDRGTGTFALGAGPLVTIPLANAVALRLGVDFLVPVVRPSFVVQLPTTTEEVHRVGPVLVRGAAGLELHL